MLLAGVNPADDAAVYSLDDGRALVFTVDYFTPIVDDPFDYGYVAAVNSMSDIYAMGGNPILALNVAGFPQESIPPWVMAEILKGGGAACMDEGVVIGGGHTISTPEILYGLAVLGTVESEKIVTKSNARPGDVLLLTKPIGLGVISTAAKAEAAEKEWLDASLASMRKSNKDAAELMTELGVLGGTDITGFGLLGHALEMARASGVVLSFYFSKIPLLPGAVESVKEEYVPGGLLKNLDFAEDYFVVGEGIENYMKLLFADPQTSGGILMAVPPDKVGEATKRLPGTAAVGEVVEGAPKVSLEP
jgi:selenide,water dikinase